MAALALVCGIFFLAASILLFWLAWILHPDLVHDAVLSAGLSLGSLGVALLLKHDAAQGASFLWLLLALK